MDWERLDVAELLALFAYIARRGYDLSVPLKDALSVLVQVFSQSGARRRLRSRGQGFNGIMGGPFAHRALWIMAEISNPLSADMPTLLGCFIPPFERMPLFSFPARERALPHAYVLDAVAAGQECLEWLQAHHQELYALLSPDHKLALRWSLLLHGLETGAAAADGAIAVLERLGCNSEALETHLHLLVEHHQTISALSRTATYFDQALVEYFEVAGRQMVNVVLIFLVNRAVLMSRGTGAAELADLNRLFEESSRVLATYRGVADPSRSLEIINRYLYKKKEQLRLETRTHQLLNQSIGQGLDKALFRPLRQHDPKAWAKLKASQISHWHKSLVLGGKDALEQQRIAAKAITELRNGLGEAGILALTAAEERLFSWFFCTFPNRYLLSSPPERLAAQIGKFARFERTEVIVDVVRDEAGNGTGLLIYTHQLTRSHARVAYMLSRKRINIISGKVNRVELEHDRHGFCYFFQISRVEGVDYFASELEAMILHEIPPQLATAPPKEERMTRSNRLEFLGDDGKGYAVKPHQGIFVRENAPFGVIRIVRKDQPFLLFKVTQAFDMHDAEIQQALITTTGNQVVDYFYLSEQECARLRTAGFAHRFAEVVRTPLL